MIIKIIPDGGIGHGAPLVIPAAQVVVCQDNGTPVFVAAHYGPANAMIEAKYSDADFHATLQKVGVYTTVLISKLEVPKPPPGAVLVAGPGVRRGQSP